MAWGDVPGKMLRPEAIRQASVEETEYSRKMKMYTEVLIEECVRATGKQPIGARWVDISKQDGDNPKYRSRLAAKGIRRAPMPGLYAGTPPFECLRMIVSDIAAGDSKVATKIMLVCDVSRAYCCAPSIRFVYVKIIDDDLEEGDANKCANLNVSMYTTRGAVLDWHAHCKGHLVGFGRKHGTVSPCVLHHPRRNIKVFIHGDDCFFSAVDHELKRSSKLFRDKYKCNVQIMGPEKDDDNMVNVLNRMVTCQKRYGHDLIAYEADSRHADI